MTPEQVEAYLSLLSRVVRPDGTVFVKQWREWHNPEDHLEVRLDDYPMPPAWTRVLHEASPVQTRFVQAAWRT